jgi:hypothetical protein
VLLFIFIMIYELVGWFRWLYVDCVSQAIKILDDEMQCDIIKISGLVRNKVTSMNCISYFSSLNYLDTWGLLCKYFFCYSAYSSCRFLLLWCFLVLLSPFFLCDFLCSVLILDYQSLCQFLSFLVLCIGYVRRLVTKWQAVG